MKALDASWRATVAIDWTVGAKGAPTSARWGTMATHNGAQASAQSCALFCCWQGWPGAIGIAMVASGDAHAIAAPDVPAM